MAFFVTMCRSVALRDTLTTRIMLPREPRRLRDAVDDAVDATRSVTRSMPNPTVLFLFLVSIVASDTGCTHRSPSISTAEAAEMVKTGSTRPHSVTNQEPITDVPSPNSLFSKRLPPDVMQHRMPDDVDIAVKALRASNCSSGGCGAEPAYGPHPRRESEQYHRHSNLLRPVQRSRVRNNWGRGTIESHLQPVK